MATTNFQVFNPALANAESDSAYTADTTRTGGLATGIANPQMHNKLFYQASIMNKALANLMIAQGQSALDTSESALTAALMAAIQSMIIPAGVSSPSFWI